MLVTLIVWSFVFISFYEHTSHLNNALFHGDLHGKTKEQFIAIVGQKPIDISYSISSIYEPLEMTTVFIYKYSFPPFNIQYEFIFTNNVLTGQGCCGT
jgi:hypothetical protein